VQPAIQAPNFKRLDAPKAAAPAQAVESQRAEMQQMMTELRAMRSMLESQLAEISWGAQAKREPMKATVMREMLAAGFSASLARYLVDKMPESADLDGMAWIQSILARNLTAVADDNALLDEGGVFALLGPTGVGKTTTTAKLAARCVMRHGAGKLALITTDGYRIGAYEQLRIYGKILGVMVHSVKDETDLRIALSELKNKHTILIDTAGASQRDQMVAEQIAMLSGADTPVKRLLCLSATSTGETLNEVVRAYRGNGLSGCILTKLDEAATLGNVLDVAIRQKLKLHYVATGQRVPEDLHLARPCFLIDRAFRMKRESAPFQLSDEELPLVVGSAARAMKDASLSEVAIG
jgi:flagellar biosynthesis protein FlhF